MPKVLTQDQIDFYHDNGFVACVDIMSEDEAISYVKRLEQAEQDFPDQLGPSKRNNAHLCFTFLDELAHHPRIIGAVEDLIGVDISLWASVLFIKEPKTQHFVSWHQDATYMGMSSNDFVTPWLALSPSNRNTGCMSMIPGSHKEHIRSHTDTFGEDNILTRGQEVEGVDERSAVDLILRPGQMSLHHGEIIHGSQANLSDSRRIGFALQSYMSPDIKQLEGDNYWMDIQGENDRGPASVILPSPKQDGALEAIELRDLVDENLTNILYKGSKEKRVY